MIQLQGAAATAPAIKKKIECNSVGRIKIADILTAINENDIKINSNHGRISTIESCTAGYGKYKTRLAGNVLYMTSDGSNP